jgi:hypothetical protein
MALWSDGKTNEEIQKLSEVDSSSVAYNLHEDLLCVKEDLAKANERCRELEARYAELRNKVGISSANIELEMNNKNHRNKILSQAKIEVLQKIKSKAVELMHKNWIISQSPSVEKLMVQPVWLSTDIIDSEIEQLRKEQDSD